MLQIYKIKTKYSYGMINNNFVYHSFYIVCHPFEMKRLNNYLERIKYNINLLKAFNTPYISKESTIIKIYFSNIDDIPFYKDINKNINLYIEYRESENGIVGYLGNYSESIAERLNILKMLSYCLYKLDELYKKRNTNKDFIIKYIILFYYIIIFLMPFEKGTASIAEMSLYLLWKYYIGTSIIIKSNILIDIEALTLPFDIFYKNCLNHNDDYTPYLLYK